MTPIGLGAKQPHTAATASRDEMVAGASATSATLRRASGRSAASRQQAPTRACLAAVPPAVTPSRAPAPCLPAPYRCRAQGPRGPCRGVGTAACRWRCLVRVRAGAHPNPTLTQTLILTRTLTLTLSLTLSLSLTLTLARRENAAKLAAASGEAADSAEPSPSPSTLPFRVPSGQGAAAEPGGRAGSSTRGSPLKDIFALAAEPAR